MPLLINMCVSASIVRDCLGIILIKCHVEEAKQIYCCVRHARCFLSLNTPTPVDYLVVQFCLGPDS